MNIVILSRSAALYSTQSLVDAAILRGHNVRVIDHMLCDLIIQSDRSRIVFQGEVIDRVDAIIPRIGSTATNHGVAVLRHFEHQGIFSTLHAEPLMRARDKLSCLQILAGYGIAVPKTIYCVNSHAIPHLLVEMEPYPVVIKLIQGTQGMGVILAETKTNAEAILEAFHTTKEKVIIQKFIKEARGADIRAFVVDGEVVGAMKRQARPGDFRSNLHRGGTAEVIKLSKHEENIALRSAEILGLQIAGVDILQTHNGPVVLEVNASPGLEGIEGTTGVDISGKIIQFVEGHVRKP
jgi:ribosomal protein S6--L-glutamate ligase